MAHRPLCISVWQCSSVCASQSIISPWWLPHITPIPSWKNVTTSGTFLDASGAYRYVPKGLDIPTRYRSMPCDKLDIRMLRSSGDRAEPPLIRILLALCWVWPEEPNKENLHMSVTVNWRDAPKLGARRDIPTAMKMQTSWSVPMKGRLVDWS